MPKSSPIKPTPILGGRAVQWVTGNPKLSKRIYVCAHTHWHPEEVIATIFTPPNFQVIFSAYPGAIDFETLVSTGTYHNLVSAYSPHPGEATDDLPLFPFSDFQSYSDEIPQNITAMFNRYDQKILAKEISSPTRTRKSSIGSPPKATPNGYRPGVEAFRITDFSLIIPLDKLYVNDIIRYCIAENCARHLAFVLSEVPEPVWTPERLEEEAQKVKEAIKKKMNTPTTFLSLEDCEPADDMSRQHGEDRVNAVTLELGTVDRPRSETIRKGQAPKVVIPMTRDRSANVISGPRPRQRSGAMSKPGRNTS